MSCNSSPVAPEREKERGSREVEGKEGEIETFMSLTLLSFVANPRETR